MTDTGAPAPVGAPASPDADAASAAGVRIATTGGRTTRLIARSISVLIVIGLFVGLAVSQDGFFTWANIDGLLAAQTFLILLALGITVLLVLNEFDLSVGYVASFAAVVGANIAYGTGSAVLGIISGIAAGMLCGAVNGLVVTVLGIPSFVATLAMGLVWFGVTYAYTGGAEVIGLPPEFSIIGQDSIGGVRIITLVVAAVVAVGWIFLERTRAGRATLAIGSNPVTSSLSGLNLTWIRVLGFMLAGLAAGLTGVFLASNQAGAGPLIATGLLLDAFTSVFLGAAMLGVRPGMLPSVLGAVTIGLINNGMTYLDFDAATGSIIRGAFLIAAIGVGRVVTGRSYNVSGT